jgi:hypothetical protein
MDDDNASIAIDIDIAIHSSTLLTIAFLFSFLHFSFIHSDGLPKPFRIQ